MRVRAKIKIKGIVQGVGFRPFIYSLATSYRLAGFVRNSTQGVIIEAEGEEEKIKKFITAISQTSPPLSVIEEVKASFLPKAGYKNFVICESKREKEKFVLISPDVCTCSQCQDELFQINYFRYLYPFINCTNCGPRFTIIKDIPYDRKNTTMAEFKMCARCQAEYDNPEDRRFHAQPNACPQCGPQIVLIGVDNKKIAEKEKAIERTIRLLKEGKIMAIKGLGGYHLACDAQNKEAVKRLRQRKYREDKPFAIMCPDINSAKKFCEISKEEEKLLLSFRRPIVLLKKKKDGPIAEEVAPDNPYLGIMLPYTPLHYLLFFYPLSERLEGKVCFLALVMTSGNISDEPIAYEDEDANMRLSNIADYFLTHNRKIYIRCDDGVSRIFQKKEMLIRRARGYVPYPVVLPYKVKEVLACGAELKNTFCLTFKNYAFISQHIGDLENLETLKSYEEGIEHFKKLFYLNPKIIAYDLHPEYLSTKYAQYLKEKNPNYRLIGVQHHHAHIVSCMVDNKISPKEKVIGVAFDGLGYGSDGNLWGGEFLIAGGESFQRVAYFKYLPLPGGSYAIKEPWRMAASYLYDIWGEDFDKLKIEGRKRINKENLDNLKIILKQKINSPLISSVGRLFDAVSSLLSLRDFVNYEGQAAVELELLAYKFSDNKALPLFYNYEIIKQDIMSIDWQPLIEGIIADLQNKEPKEKIALKFHYTIAKIIVEVARLIRDKWGINLVVISGGVFQNMLLLKKTVDLLRRHKFLVFTHHQVPTNDGGISLGQAIVAHHKIKGEI